MIADLIQPSLQGQIRAFGAPYLFGSSDDKRLLIVQSPPMAIGPEYAARKGISFGMHGALSDSAREWVRIVLKSKPKPRATHSVLDMPPLDLGELLHPTSEDGDLLSEMLDDTRF